MDFGCGSFKTENDNNSDFCGTGTPAGACFLKKDTRAQARVPFGEHLRAGSVPQNHCSP
jgi:hypothetical protein